MTSRPFGQILSFWIAVTAVITTAGFMSWHFAAAGGPPLLICIVVPVAEVVFFTGLCWLLDHLNDAPWRS